MLTLGDPENCCDPERWAVRESRHCRLGVGCSESRAAIRASTFCLVLARRRCRRHIWLHGFGVGFKGRLRPSFGRRRTSGRAPTKDTALRNHRSDCGRPALSRGESRATEFHLNRCPLPIDLPGIVKLASDTATTGSRVGRSRLAPWVNNSFIYKYW